MQQVLFHIPFTDIPIYGYGMMLFLAFLFCTWLAVRLASREGIPAQPIQDLAIWLFIGGIAGARITYMIQYGVPIWDFFRIWDGGLVFYGSAIGGVAGYFLAHFFVLRKHGISSWKMADVIAPCAALGLALGRVGCLLNGCCYGNVACADCPAVSFPLPTMPRADMVKRGYQTDAGFTVHERNLEVDLVEPGSAAQRAGLLPDDRIVKVNGKSVDVYGDLATYLGPQWQRGENELVLTVRRAGGGEETLRFTPYGIGLHPTQVYESISMVLLFTLLLAYHPLRWRPGSVMVLFMLGYAVHRFLNEMLRTDTDPVAFGMTLSQNISIAVFTTGVLLGLYLWLRPESRPPDLPGDRSADELPRNGKLASV